MAPTDVDAEAGCWGCLRRIHRARREVGTGRLRARARLPLRFLSAPRRHAVNGASPLEGVPARMRRYELMLVIRPDVAGRQEPGCHRPDHPPDRRRRRPDRQGRPLGPPPAGLSDRSPPRRLVPDRPVRGAARRHRRARAHPAHHRRGDPPPRHPRRAPGQGRARRWRRGRRPRRGDVLPPDRRRGGRGRRRELIDESESEAAPAAID